MGKICAWTCTSALMSLKLANLAGKRHKSSPPLTPYTPNPFIFMQKCYIYGYKPLCDLRCAYSKWGINSPFFGWAWLAWLQASPAFWHLQISKCASFYLALQASPAFWHLQTGVICHWLSTYFILTRAAGGTTNQRMDDFKGYTEARLGKPSHLLEGDKLRQFLENNKRVGVIVCQLLAWLCALSIAASHARSAYLLGSKFAVLQ